MIRRLWLYALCIAAYGQGWQQWGQNSLHTGAVAVSGQKLEQIHAEYLYDHLADQIRQDHGGSLLVHYMTPLVLGDEIFVLSRGESQWVSCRDNFPPCGARLWGTMQWGLTKLRRVDGTLEKQWTAISSWKPAPDSGTGWEPVFHPAVWGRSVYMPGAGGMVMQFDRETGELVDCLTPFDEDDPNRFITSPLTIDARGAIYYTVMKLDPENPWTSDVLESFLVKIDPCGVNTKISFVAAVPDAPSADCLTTFSMTQLPWPPAPDAKPPAAPCGLQRAALNAAPAVAEDGTVYAISRAHFNASYGYLVAFNPDLTPRWAASLRDRLQDGCDVLLPPSGTLGGCRFGAQRGVDPATNGLPAGRVEDRSTASPVVAPDGSILYGAYTRYNYRRGHLFRFSPTGEFLSAYDFGWDITPAIVPHDGSWSVVIKDNSYAVGSYCDVLGHCGFGEPNFSMTSLTPDLTPEWKYRNTNDQSCERTPDGIVCEPHHTGFDWCVNMVAVDSNGTLFANSEDGNVYAIDRTGQLVGRLFLKKALGAAYTPLAIGEDGLIYTQNNGTLFIIGELPHTEPAEISPQ
jgi:outer membrane protein assembly factor BamB